MEDLPDEVLLMILSEYLPVSDLVKCRLLSKRFNFLVDNFVKLKRLEFDYYGRFFNTTQTCQLSYVTDKQKAAEPTNVNQLVICNFPVFYLPRHSSFQLLCSNLKSLTLTVNFKLTILNMAELNGLVKLEQLFIYKLFILDTYPRPALDLPNLKLLSIQSVRFLQYREAGRIQKLVVRSKIKQLFYQADFEGSSLELKHPDHVSLLKIANLKENLSSFKNLRVLHCKSISEPNANILELLPNLEEISLQAYCPEEEHTRRTVSQLMSQRAALNRHQLKIYYFGVLLNKPYEDYDFEKFEPKFDNLVAMHLHHYGQLAEHLPYVYRVNYDAELADRLADSVVGKKLPLNSHGFPVDFFERTNIQEIRISEIPNSDRLASFLKQCKRVRELHFERKAGAQLEQSLVDLIADLYAFSLNWLSILDVNKELDLGPVSNLNQPLTLKVIPLDLRFILELFRKSRNLYCVYTNYEGDLAFSKRRGQYEVLWDCKPERFYPPMTYEELKTLINDKFLRGQLNKLSC